MVVDLHEDIGYYYLMGGVAEIEPFDKEVKERQADIPKYREVGMKLVLGSIFPLVGSLNRRKIKAMQEMYGVWSPSSSLASPRDIAIELVKIYYALEDLYPKSLKIIRTRDEIERLGKATGIVMHIEGCEALGEPEDLRIFYNLGVRSIGLTWNYDNKYAASCMSTKDYGLTGEGEALVALANRLGVMVDLSHSSPKTSSDTLEASEAPPFFSHSNSLAIQNNKRNVSDSLIRRTARLGGVVGLTFIRSCIGEPYTPEKLAVHAKHLVELDGSLPALGTDYLGMQTTPVGLDDLSRLGRFRKALKATGLSSGQIDGILNDNAYNFILKQSERW
ncbi:MAG TPA: membrane dipeptidase [Nitrososphaerales archaeon]|nr:membrane dipeptidase [Nitrososphaerales archaeon]